MTTYGTIPTSTQPGPATPTSIPSLVSGAKARAKTHLANRRPWKEFVHARAFALPHGVADCYLRVRTNLSYFSMNYAIIALGILFLSLLWHPISLIVFVVMMAVWLFLYFLREQPLVLFGRTVGDRVVLVVLLVVTVVALLFTGATGNIVGALITAAIVVLVHALFRKTDDLCLDEETTGGGGGGGGGGGRGGWYTVIDTPTPAPATSSSSSSK